MSNNFKIIIKQSLMINTNISAFYRTSRAGVVKLWQVGYMFLWPGKYFVIHWLILRLVEQNYF